MFFALIDFFNCLLQFQCVIDQAAERRGQLIQRRFRQRLGIHQRQNSLASQQHLVLQVERQAVALAFLFLAITPPQVVLDTQPSLKGARRNLQKFAHARDIAIMFLYFVQRIDLGA
ncbi:MAG: hypothetical protein OXG84_18000 [Chloroflexi bacterium]|nr:hypothetical protein [Chloroflexota bacterium]